MEVTVNIVVASTPPPPAPTPPPPAPIMRRVRRWSSTGVMGAAGFDVNQVNTSNFQAVKTYAKEVGFGGVTSFLRIPSVDVYRIRNMQTADNYTVEQKMEWLCSYRGSIYMYENENDDWRMAASIRWGTITIGGNLVQVEGYETITVQGTVYNMARLRGFRATDWGRPLPELIAEGLVHRCYCAYLPDNGFGDSPKGIVYSPFFSPKDWDFAGTAQPDNLYIPTDWLEDAPTAEYWRGDAETGDKSQWCKQTVQANERIQIVSSPSPVLQGSHSYRVEVQPGDNPSGCRATLATGPSGTLGGDVHFIRSGHEAFYGLSVFLPSATFVKVDKWRLVLQFKGYPDSGSPPMSLNIRGNDWLFNYRPNISSAVLTKRRFPFIMDSWEKFMMHIKWSENPSEGFAELYYNGSLVVPKFSLSNMHVMGGVVSNNFVALGLYRDAAHQTTDVIYHDGFVTGRSYDEVRQ